MVCILSSISFFAMEIAYQSKSNTTSCLRTGVAIRYKRWGEESKTCCWQRLESRSLKLPWTRCMRGSHNRKRGESRILLAVDAFVRWVMPSTTTTTCQAKASYKKIPGLLELTKTHLQWTQQGKQAPVVRIEHKDAACESTFVPLLFHNRR